MNSLPTSTVVPSDFATPDTVYWLFTDAAGSVHKTVEGVVTLKMKAKVRVRMKVRVTIRVKVRAKVKVDRKLERKLK